MKNNTLANLYAYCRENNMEFLFFPLEDAEFFARYSDGIPIYNEKKCVVNNYSMVFLDGPHDTNSIKKEFDFFKERMRKGSAMVFDDIDHYPHMDNLDPYIRSNGFEIFQKGTTKISYIKML